MAALQDVPVGVLTDLALREVLLALVVAGAAALHVVLSRFYLAGLAQALLFAALTLTMCLGRSGWDRVTLRTPAPLTGFLALGAVAVGLFAAIRTLAA